jgi:transposase-like protein
MGKRGPKPQFFDVACPNKNCKLYGLTNQGNITGNGTYISRGKKTRRYVCHQCGKVFNDHTGTFYHDLRKDEQTIDLALKMSMKGMSIEAIADVLEVESASVKRWLARAANQCDKVNDSMMKDVDVPKIEMDELWIIIQKKSS